MENLTKETFKEKIFDFEANNEWNFKGNKPCIVDFYADWCGPCQMLKPIFEDLSNDLDDKIKFYKIDTDQNKDLAREHNISGIPCMIIFKDGKEYDRIVGFLSKEGLKEKIESLIK